MAAPSYTEDLTDISLMESGETGAAALNISGGGGGAPAFGADFGMQGAGCWDKAASNAERAILTNNAPGAGVTAAGAHVFQWGFVATPGVLDTLVNRGVYVIAGTAATAYVQYHVDGFDTLGAQGRVGKCFVYRYVTTAQTGKVPYRTVTGTPGTPPDEFGYGIKTLATVKGSNFGQDAHRYGTGAYLTAGELLSAGDASDDPATFVGFNLQNDSINNRWGILTSIGGTSYELQGRFVIGQNNAQSATACSFRDSNINISLVDTVHAESDFTQLILDHASTWVEWNNVNVTALGQINPGRLVVNSADPEFLYSGGTLSDIGISTLRSNTTAVGVTWRGCGEITANGATLAGSSIFHGSKIIDAQDETSYNNSPTTEGTFDGGTTGHVAADVLILDDGTRIVVDTVSAGVVTEFTVDSARSKVGGATISMVSTTGAGDDFSLTPDTDNYTESSGLLWNTAVDPTGLLDDMEFGNLTPPMTHAIEFGTASPTTMTLNNCAFGTDYSATEDGAVGNETFHFLRTTGAITLNLVNCTGNFGYKVEGTATVDIVIDPVTTKLTITTQAGVPIDQARVLLETGDNGGGSGLPYQAATTSLTQTGGTATLTASAVHGLETNDYVVIRGAGDEGYNRQAQITVTSTTVFTYTVDSGISATAGGTPVFSYAALSGLTSTLGVIQSSKTWPASQSLIGWARKSTSTPYYRQTAIAITDASGGTDIAVALQSDE